MQVMRKYLFCLLFAALALCGCKKDEYRGETGVWPTPYLITNYLLIEEISCFHHENQANNAIYLRFSGENIYDAKATEDKFAYLSNMYNDTSFTGSTHPGAYSALAYPFDEITLSCNSDYDAEHLAGEPLDDIVKLKFESYWDFLQNGYQYPEWYTEKVCGYGRVPYELYLSELNSNNSKLVSIKQSPMIFTTSPATPGEYTFTLELTTNGETFTTTFTHKFE